ncbi:glycosyltransferase [Flexivirga caeni]|uniref:glycosyltransferase n=1 Tax=Flexivirga caeni TaxID=2294115 RepID=UPI0011CE3048|nr:glycosyltransferase [Flexivirga caeni]
MTDEDTTSLAVTALLVVQHSDHPRLNDTLDSLLTATRRPERLVVIDATPGRCLPELLADHPAIGSADWAISVVTVPAGTPFAEIIDTAVTALPDPGEDTVVPLRSRRRARRHPVRPRDRDEWLWLLHEDSAPAPDALAQLVTVASASDRIGIAGCKILDSDDPRRLVNVGIDLTRTGRHVGSSMQGEPDQGQHDGRRDVLAVSSAGMLIRRDVYLSLGGFDPAFDGDGDGLDISWRAHLIGRQVIVVPRARAHQDLVGKDSDVDRPAPRSPRTIRRHRQVALARCSLLGLPFMALWILVSCTLLCLLMLVLKRPRRAFAEFAQATAPLGVARIVGARWRFVGRATTRRRNLRGVFVPWRGAVEHALTSVGDAIVLEPTRRDIPQTEPVETGPVGDDAESMPVLSGRQGVWRNPGLWLVLALLAAAAVSWRDLITGGALRGAGNGLTGGALQPFTTNADGVWRMWRDAWTGPGLGAAATPTPYLVVLAPLAWVAQQLPGVHGSASGAAVVAWLLVLAMPLSGLTAYRAGRVATHARWPRAAAALAWASLPTLTTAVAGGRLGPVVGHILFPFALAGCFEIARRRASTPVTCGTIAVIAVIGAFAPPLMVLTTVIGVVLLVIGPGWARLRGLAVAVVPWALLGWWTRSLLTDWRPVLAGPGGLDTVHSTPPWHLLLLQPGGPGSYWLWAGLPVLALGAAGLVRTGFGKASTGLALVGLLGLAAALAASHLHLVRWSDGVRTPWSGLGLDIFAAALIGAALLGLRGVLAERPDRGPLARRRLAVGVTTGAGVVFAAVTALAAWQGTPTPSLGAAPAAPSSVVSAQLTGPSAVRYLQLTIAGSGTITYQLTGRETGAPATGLRQPVPSGGPLTAAAAQTLLEPDRASQAVAGLRSLAVGFVVVDGPGNRAPVTAILQQAAGLTQVSGAARAAVWRVDPAASPGGEVVASSRVWLSLHGSPVGQLPSTTAHARSTTRLPAGPAGRYLEISEGPGWRELGRVTIDGHPVPAVVRDGLLSYPMPASGGRLVIDPGVAHRRIALGQGALGALVLFLAIPFGNRRSRRMS